ncbi:MAG: 6-phosphogluconolactonase [bacterium]|nr:6-phosphogluconolactonase [bacterium]
MKPIPEIVIAGDEGFAVRAAIEITRVLRATLSERDAVSLALAGGATPRPVYRALAAVPAGLRPADWRRVHFFWSDERCVPADDPGSNVNAAHEQLLRDLDIAPERIHAPRLARDPRSTAAAYEGEIRRTLRPEATATPRFDLVLLGVGADGHTASLFPGEPPEAHPGRSGLVVATRSPAAPHERISFSFELLAAARRILILASGEDKAEVVYRVLEERDRSLPVTQVDPRSGVVCWVLDAAAASRLPQT